MRSHPYVVVLSGFPPEADFLLRALDDLELPTFSERDIQPGERWAERLRTELNTADVVLVGAKLHEAEFEALENTKSRRSMDPAFKIIPLVSGSEHAVHPLKWLQDVEPLLYDANNPSRTISSLVKILIPNPDNREPLEPDNSKPATPKTTLQQFLSPGRLVKLLFLFSAGIVVAVAAMYVFPTSRLVSILAWACIILSVLALLFLLYWYLQPETKPTPSKDVADIYIKIASSALFILSLVVAWKSFENTSRQTARNLELAQITLENNRAEQRSKRFTDALERLGGETPSQRLAGVYAFTQLDSDFKPESEFKEDLDTAPEAKKPELKKQRAKELDEHWAIIQILTSHIQHYSSVPEDDSTKARDPRDEPVKDINGILQYLGTRKLTYGAGEEAKLDFNTTDLTGYFKGEIPGKCGGTTCNPDPDCTINFEGANFTNANLIEADFKGANLRNAKFDGAKLIKARFDCTDLTGAEFWNADISGANFSRVQFISDDKLRAAFGDADTQCPAGFMLVAGTCVKPPVVKEPAKL